MKPAAKKTLWITGGVVALLLVGVAALGMFWVRQAKDALDQMAQPATPQREIGVYVLEDDPAQTLEDTAGYAYGGVEAGAGSLALVGQALGQEPPWQEYPTAFALADALGKGERQAAVLEVAYQQSLSDARGYEWTETGMRQVGSLYVEEEAPLPSVPQEAPERFVVYLSGSDTFGPVSTLARSDVNILAAVNTREKRLFLLATPRDFYVSFSQTGGAMDKLTHAGIYGVEASVDALEALYGVDIAYYLRMNFTGFVEVIDALGGVSVYSDREFTVENIRTYQQGYNQLTGIEALAFARERMSFPEGDYQRAKNQMEVIRAVVEKCSSFALVQNFRPVLEAAGEHLETNMPKEHLYGLAALQLGDPGPWTVETYTAQGESAYRETWSMPGQELYVILPGEASVQEAKEKLAAALG